MEQEDAMQFQTVDHAFTVIDSDTVPVVIDDSLAEAIARGRSDWHTLQKESVSIHRYRIKEWNMKEITAGVYQWTLGYDDFLGYMSGILNKGDALFC